MGGGAYSESSSATAANKSATNTVFGGISFGPQGNAASAAPISGTASSLIWYVVAAFAVAIVGFIAHKKKFA